MNIMLQLLAGALSCVLFIILMKRVSSSSSSSSSARLELKVYALSLVIAALIYVMFAARGGAAHGARLWLELAGLVLFLLFAALGLKVTPAFLAVGWACHAAWDLILHKLTDGAFVPSWYPLTCLSFDLVLAAYIIVRFKRSALSRAD
jgi:hypothetical protein